MKISPLFLTDHYKYSHPKQYPVGTEYVYSNTTPRGSRMEGVNEVVVFGIQYLVKEYLINQFNEFFESPKSDIAKFKRVMDHTLGKDGVDYSKFEALHDLGYLPVKIKALPEGTLCPLRVPFMIIVNTHPDFYWLTNFLETLTQTVVWQAVTSATIADRYRKLLDSYAEMTVGNNGFVSFQGHDFSMRGMSSVESGMVSGAAHLLSFAGTDTVPAVVFLEQYYGADLDNELVGCSVPASEHAVATSSIIYIEEELIKNGEFDGRKLEDYI